MVSEKICLDIIKDLYGKMSTLTTKHMLSDDKEEISESRISNALSAADLYRPLLARYDLQDIDSAVRWLTLGGYLRSFGFGITNQVTGYELTRKGCEVVERGQFPDEERKLFYRENPYAVFIAHQFNKDDQSLVRYIRDDLLKPRGFHVVSGRAMGLEQFRVSILNKIRDSRFFICLLTKRVPLESGGYISSVWLYQEIGAAMAFGKNPLLLVEQGIDSHFVGEFQKIYEHIPFTRSNHTAVFPDIIRRLEADLEGSMIPLPKPNQGPQLL